MRYLILLANFMKLKSFGNNIIIKIKFISGGFGDE